jgi:hypothetical protein
MARVRVNLTLHPDIVTLAQTLMAVRKFDQITDFISVLIREEYDRRGHPPLISSSPEENKKGSTDKVMEIVRKPRRKG